MFKVLSNAVVIIIAFSLVGFGFSLGCAGAIGWFSFIHDLLK